MAIKILVVDNNPVLLKAVSTILSQEGCDVQTAGTGLEALEILEEYSPEIVFTDLIMPLVSGEQLCRIIRHTKKHYGMFIVVLSAIILEDRERILHAVDCDLCIAKGSLQEMRLHLQEALQIFNERKFPLSEVRSKVARIPEGLKPSAMASELLSEKRHLTMILANLDEGILELSQQGKVVTVNEAALNILACREEMIIGVPLPEAAKWGIYQDPIRDWEKEQLLKQGMEVLNIFEDSPLILGEKVVTGSFIPVSEPDSVFGLCILRDISRQFHAEKHNRELDNAIRLAKKMDAMSCMAGGVAHDFNNLLTVICGNLDIVTSHGDKQTENDRVELLEESKKAAMVAVDLTRQISCFSNFGILHRENVSVEHLVRKSVEGYFGPQKDGCELCFIGEDCTVHIDFEEISKSITNVLQNAREASPQTEIEINVGNLDLAEPKLMSGQFVPAGLYARIDVRDFGEGIAPEQLFEIFDPYYSTKERGPLKGMGLGLTVVYAIFRNHGGYVIVSSELGKGTTVSLYLPVLQEDEKKNSLQGEDEQERFVLLIEPNKRVNDIGRTMLNYLGFSVTLAGNRAEAIEGLKQLKNDSKLSLPLVILDLSESGGENGAETCRLLHEIDPRIKVIGMSGTTLGPVMENCLQYGFVNILPKPYTMDSLKHITNTVLYN